MNRNSIVAACFLVSGLVLPALAEAGDVTSFYNGRTVKMLVPSAAGGGYDNFARVTVRHLQLPGSPTIIVQNMPGAGGLIAANYLYKIAPKDGTMIGLVNRYTVVQAVIKNKRAKFDPTKFVWLGTPTAYDQDPYVLIVRGKLPYRTVKDIRSAKEPLVVGYSGSDIPLILEPALGMKVKLILYKSKGMVDLALQRGEVDSLGVAYANLRKRHLDWIKRKTVRPLVQFVKKRSSLLPDVPASSELVRTAEQRAILDFVEVPLAMGYPFALPPGLPADRVSAIRKAFDRVFVDPAYRDDVVNQGLAYAPKSGQEVAESVMELVAAPQSAIQRYRDVVGVRGGK